MDRTVFDDSYIKKVTYAFLSRFVGSGAAGKNEKAALEEKIKSLEGALQRTKDELNDVYR